MSVFWDLFLCLLFLVGISERSKASLPISGKSKTLQAHDSRAGQIAQTDSRFQIYFSKVFRFQESAFSAAPESKACGILFFRIQKR